MTTSFTNLLKGQTRKSTKPIPWNDTHEESIQPLKEHLCQAPSLLLLDPSKPFEVETDATDYAVGVVFYQDGKPVEFESKKHFATQCWYPIQEKELFAIIHALKTRRNYLYGNHFVVTTNHQSLKYFGDQQDLMVAKLPEQNLFKTLTSL